MITFVPSAKFDKDAAVIFCTEEQVSKTKLPAVHKEIQKEINSLIQNSRFTGSNGELWPLLVNKRTVLLAGLGKSSDFSLTGLRISVRQALLSSFVKKAAAVEVIPHDSKDEIVQAVIEGIVIGTYSWRKYKTQDNNSAPKSKKYYLSAASKKIYEDTLTICEGVTLARDLVNDNADFITSQHIESVIRGLISGKKNISIEVLNEKEMKAKGLGLHLAVNQGSAREPKLIIVRYQGGSKNEPFTALVGKGMTFDTGGLNLKPTGSIETMRTDMSGTAAVVGTLKNVIALKLKKNIIFTCAVAENTIGSRAFKPGDVIKGYAGKTVEIANTDAEGRLVLADAISYLIKNYKPGRIIDIATLTGACVVALGHDYSGLVTTRDDLSRDLVHASNATDDRVWRLPLYPELHDAVKSRDADIRNLGFPKGAAGALTAAEFLHQFVDKTPWAHLDIAGTAYVDGDRRLYYGHGGTGVGVRLFTHYLQTCT